MALYQRVESDGSLCARSHARKRMLALGSLMDAAMSIRDEVER